MSEDLKAAALEYHAKPRPGENQRRGDQAGGDQSRPEPGV